MARKRNQVVVEQNKTDAETPSMDIASAPMNNKGEVPDKHEERTMKTKETKTLQSSHPQENISRYGKPKRKAPNPGEGMKRNKMASKPARPDKPPRPNSIMKMAALIKGKRKAPNPPSKPPKEVQHDKVAIVKPFDPLAETNESKEGENNTTDTEVQIENQPNKPAVSETICEEDDGVDNKNKNSSNDTADERNDVTVDKDVDNNEFDDNDNEMNETEPNLYENVKSKQNKHDYGAENIIDESRQSIMLSDNYPNLSRSRTSVV